MFNLFGRKKKEREEKNLEELIDSLSGEQSLQFAVIDKSINKIGNSKNEVLIGKVIAILTENSRYQSLSNLCYNNAEMLNRYKSILPTGEIIALSDYLKNNDSLALLEGMEGVEQKIKKIISEERFYENHPVTAVKKAISMEDYELAGKAFAYLRKNLYEYFYPENEIVQLGESLVDLNRLKHLECVLRIIPVWESKPEKLVKEADELEQRLIGGINSLLLIAKDPKKAFEFVGDAFINYPDKHDKNKKEPIYWLAMEYYLLSENKDKILETADKALNAEYLSRSYGAAFLGFKALLTKFYLLESDGEKRDEIIWKIKTTICRDYDTYLYNRRISIEAAELTGDFSSLKNNLCHSIENWCKMESDVYSLLKEKGAIDDADIIRATELYIIRQRSQSDMNGQFKKALDFARLIKGQKINRDLIMSTIAEARLREDIVKEGFGYLRDTGQIKANDEKVYSLIAKN